METFGGVGRPAPERSGVCSAHCGNTNWSLINTRLRLKNLLYGQFSGSVGLNAILIMPAKFLAVFSNPAEHAPALLQPADQTAR